MKKQIFLLTFLTLHMFQNTYAESLFEDKFQDQTKWKFISDNVMGGLSTGSIVYEMKRVNPQYFTGDVITENTMFHTARRNVKEQSKEANFVKIIAKRNKKYYIHLRTSGTILPWQYYQSSFAVEEKYNVTSPKVNLRKLFQANKVVQISHQQVLSF